MEDEIAKNLYGEFGTFDSSLGFYRSVYAGFAAEGDFRQRGSSGGLGRWVLCKLLEIGMVDAVVQVVQAIPHECGGLLFRYQVTTSIDEARKGAKSAYYPVEMSAVLQSIREQPASYAIVGLPCFIKAVRLLAARYTVFESRIRFCVGLICGHLKSARYADMLAWQVGIPPGQLLSIDFRAKLPGRKANEKGIEIAGTRNGKRVKITRVAQEFFGADYNYGFFKYNACDYCDDVFAETADLALGDAWLPQYLEDGRGTSILIVRHPEIERLLNQGVGLGQLHLDRIEPHWAAKSQEAALRHRREGLSYRLHLAEKSGRWHPPKRVKAQHSPIGRHRQLIYELRMRMAEESHIAFAQASQEGNFGLFHKRMEKLIREYKRIYGSTSLINLNRVLNPLWTRSRSMFRKIFPV